MSRVPLATGGFAAALERLAFAGIIGALACSSAEKAEPAEPAAGSLQVEWIGSDTGRLSVPGVAEWCDSLRMLELSAIQGDTGVALVLYPADSVRAAATLRPGDYPVRPPERADSVRPSSAVALRWFAETSIRGFRGDSGSVVLESVGPAGTVAGRFSARLRSVTEGSRLKVTGSFTGLTVRPAAAGCVGRRAEESADTAEEGEDTIDTDME